MTDKMIELKELLTDWRRREKDHANAVLRAAVPWEVSELRDAEEKAVARLRRFVDSEPWPEL